MFSREWIEKFDASHGIPRKANEQYLPAYQAFVAWAGDVGQAVFFIFFGVSGVSLSLFAGYLLNVSGIMWLVFWSLAVLSLSAGFFDICMLCWSYKLFAMSTSHGSARWANIKDLIAKKLINRIKGLPLPKNVLPIAKVFGGRDLYLPREQWLRHFAMFGPTGSGKSKTFFMAMIRAILKHSSCLVYDPKGELIEQTGNFAQDVYRLDLNNPEKSDRWNFLPLARENPAFACQIAGMMLGAESRQKTSQDPFWGEAEQLALTAILLHLAFIYGDRAIPAFAADFLIGLGGQEDAFAAQLENSPSFFAKQAFFAFRRSPPQTHGSVLIGLYTKLRPFTLAVTRSVTTMPTAEEAEKGCRVIDFSKLRKKGTAIYLVVSEGAAEIYKEVIATFLGQAVLEMRLDGVNEPEIPCFVLIDEAYQLNVAEVKRISGIGRGRGVGLGLGYQDLPQMYDQYGKEQANAILGTVMTKIFLPGLDDVTAEYASKQLGETTMFSKTYQDFPGKQNDNIRFAEQKRSLMHAGEVRQIAAHQELIILNDTAPPIKASYPPIAVMKQKYFSPVYGTGKVIYLGDIDDTFKFHENTENFAIGDSDIKTSSTRPVENNGSNQGNTNNRIIENSVGKVVDEVWENNLELGKAEIKDMQNQPDYLNEKEDLAVQMQKAELEKTKAAQPQSKEILTKEIKNQVNPESSDQTDALNGLSNQVQRKLDAHVKSKVSVNRV
ncbi:MAG TPA: type IV secretory system conjugative DNA transfer family protein [Pyrinomonadaceae bacterium]|nr:type IV secretory system conjugative DNA transfer family protein [Pyrinomonadaceae bacterium]